MIRSQGLLREWLHDPAGTATELGKALQKGEVKPSEFSLRDMAANLIYETQTGEPIGEAGLRILESDRQRMALAESTGVITTSAFRTITNRIVSAAVMEGARFAEPVISPVLPVVEGRLSRTEFVMPTVPQGPGRSFTDIGEGEEYPIFGIQGERVKTLPARKKGFQIPLTRELVLSDDTGTLLQSARDAGAAIARAKENLCVDFVAGFVQNCVIEQLAGDPSDVVSNLFLTSGRWTNDQVNQLVDWTSIDNALALIQLNVVPSTGDPPVVNQQYLVVPQMLYAQAYRILNAIETWSAVNDRTVVAPTPFRAGEGGGGTIRILVSPHLYFRATSNGFSDAQARGVWFFGDLAQAFGYYQLWPIEVEEDSSPAQRLTHDIWVRFRVSECGIPFVKQPRVWTRNRVS
jgi:hypothetical protein